ncbi:hypothetical protein [Bacillus sp. FJAT-27251]|nr:hypothetical protein [Bacillus sp. FJAT-27251]
MDIYIMYKDDPIKRGGKQMTWIAAAIGMVMLAYFVYLAIVD